MAILIHSNGSHETISPEDMMKFTEEELHELVGGEPEVINLYDGRVLVMDSMAHEYGKSFNYVASMVLKHYYEGFILGDVVICNT